MIGIIIMVGGIILFITGLIIYKTANKKKQIIDNNIELKKVIEMAIADGVLTSNERGVIKQMAEEKGLNTNEIIAHAEKQILESEADSETQIIDVYKKNGDDFEKFVVQKFNKKYYTIKEWAGDKFINGHYADTTPQPDLLLELSLTGKKYEFYVECKWRRNLYKNGVEVAGKNQLDRYKKFQKDKNIPVFIVIGIGGKGISPEQLFIVPLKNLDDNFIYISKLKNYRKNIEKDFFYDIEKEELR
jgi:hypothetical protein